MPVGRTACPHCQREIYSNSYGRHIARCTHSPQVMHRVRDIISTECEGDVLTQTEYCAMAARHKLPIRQDVVAHFGSWQAFANWAGKLSAYNHAEEWDMPAERLQRSTQWDWPQTFAAKPTNKVYYHWQRGAWVAGQVLELR